MWSFFIYDNHLHVLCYVLNLQELARSLKQVQTSKEETSDEFERLRGKKDEMDIQLIELQQSINTVSTLRKYLAF